MSGVPAVPNHSEDRLCGSVEHWSFVPTVAWASMRDAHSPGTNDRAATKVRRVSGQNLWVAMLPWIRLRIAALRIVRIRERIGVSGSARVARERIDSSSDSVRRRTDRY